MKDANTKLMKYITWKYKNSISNFSVPFTLIFHWNWEASLSLSYALKSWSVMWHGKRRNRTRSLEVLRLPVTERVVWGVLEWQAINYRSKTYLDSREIDVLDMITDFTEECTLCPLICNWVHEEREGVDTMQELSVGWPRPTWLYVHCLCELGNMGDFSEPWPSHSYIVGVPLWLPGIVSR